MLPALDLAVSSAGALLEYLYETQKITKGLRHIAKLERFVKQERIFLDRTTQFSLELVQTSRGQEFKGSLLWVLDKTLTGMALQPPMAGIF